MQEQIIKQVLEALGRPPLLVRVTARNVYDNRWRVNVWCERPVASDTIDVRHVIADNHIPHSYSLTVDQKGKITGSSPELVQRYPVTVVPACDMDPVAI